MKSWWTTTALVISLSVASMATADQKDARLPALFKDLIAAPTPQAAHMVETEIWLIWAQTGDPKQDEAFELGSQAIALGDYRTAFAVFHDLTQRAPDFAEGWNKLATVEYLMGEYQLSLESIDRTLALEPRHFGALSGLGLVNMELNREEAALDAFERVLTIYPMSLNAKANAEFVRQQLKDKGI